MYKDIINNICKNIHTGLVDFDEPRSEASMPTQASSEFITNKQQGDWAEDVIFRAINDNSNSIVAVRYGKSDDLVAGDAGFEQFLLTIKMSWIQLVKDLIYSCLTSVILMNNLVMTLVLIEVAKLVNMFLKPLLV